MKNETFLKITTKLLFIRCVQNIFFALTDCEAGKHALGS